MFNLKNLCRQTIVYPSPDQMVLRGSKLYVIDQLRQIARKVTHTDYPEVVLIDNPQHPSLADRPGVFMKRSFSDSAAHVLRVCSAEAAVHLPAMVADTKAFYDHDSVRRINVVPEWFGMAFVPEMSQKGEIRAFFIGGHLTHIISTTPSDRNLTITQVFALTPLLHLSYVVLHTRFLFIHSIVHRKTEGQPATATPSTAELHDSHLPSYLQDQGSEDFKKFVTQTYYGLIHTDEQILDKGQVSDFRVFCRVDVSVYMDMAGVYHFYVSEVAATHKAGLFLAYTHNQAPRIATDFANAFRALVAFRRAGRARLARSR